MANVLPPAGPSGNGPAGGTVKAEPASATASSAHDMLIAIAVLSVFVFAMVLIAGTGKNAGRTIVFLFTALLILQGMTHVNPFLEWIVSHPVNPKRTP